MKNRELALLCGCSLPTVQKWRSGNVPLPAVVHRFLAVLDAAYQGDNTGLKCFVERVATTAEKEEVSAAMVEEFAEQTVEAGATTRASFPATRTPDELMLLYKARAAAAQQARQRGEESERMRDRMLAEMSYQLRTPMNSILGAGQILQQELSGSALSELADVVLMSGDKMMSVIDSLGVFSGEKAPDGPTDGLVALVAEDDAAGQVVLCAMLRKLGLQTERVGNGLEAIHAAGRQFFNFIFMDIEMPVMNGLDAVREIRRREKKEGLEPTFICAATAYVRPGDREKCLAAGMDAYLAKPIGMEALAGVIKSRETTERRVL